MVGASEPAARSREPHYSAMTSWRQRLTPIPPSGEQLVPALALEGSLPTSCPSLPIESHPAGHGDCRSSMGRIFITCVGRRRPRERLAGLSAAVPAHAALGVLLAWTSGREPPLRTKHSDRHFGWPEGRKGRVAVRVGAGGAVVRRFFALYLSRFLHRRAPERHVEDPHCGGEHRRFAACNGHAEDSVCCKQASDPGTAHDGPHVRWVRRPLPCLWFYPNAAVTAPRTAAGDIVWQQGGQSLQSGLPGPLSGYGGRFLAVAHAGIRAGHAV